MPSTTKRAREQAEKNVYRYMRRVRVLLIVDVAVLAALLPVTYLDKNAWTGGFPLIFAALIPAVLYFLWVLWRDSRQSVTLTKDGVVWETGAWRWKKTVEIPFAEIGQMRDVTALFSPGRKYALVSAVSPKQKIVLTGALERYRELLGRIVRRLPKGALTARAEKSLRQNRVIGR